MKKTENQTKKKGMYLVATFGTVAFIALGALAVGMMNPKDGKVPKSLDLNATPTPGPGKPTEVVKQDTGRPVTPAPTKAPTDRIGEDGKQNQGDSVQKTAQTPEETGRAEELQTTDNTTGAEDTAVVSSEGILKGLNFSAETGMLWPVTGDALISFSPNHAIYHKTLDSYRTSDYVVLGSEVGAHVSAAADGIVTSVKEELKTGTTVSMRISEDHEIAYGLLSDVTVKEGDFVDAGTVFATVAEPTRYFLEDGSGVYIKLLEKGEAINPMLYLQ